MTLALCKGYQEHQTTKVAATASKLIIFHNGQQKCILQS